MHDPALQRTHEKGRLALQQCCLPARQLPLARDAVQVRQRFAPVIPTRTNHEAAAAAGLARIELYANEL